MVRVAPNVCSRLACSVSLALSLALTGLGCTLDVNGTGELMASADGNGADTGLPQRDAAGPDAGFDSTWPDSAYDGTVTEEADAPEDGPEEADAPQDAPEDGPEEADAPEQADVSAADAQDCDAIVCGADGGDGGDAGNEGGQNICDVDQDGESNATCGGGDCCDTDPNVNSGQTSFFAAANACGGWDYNCDGVDEKRWTAVGDACHLCYVFACCTDEGDYISGPPGCGQSAQVGGCGGWPGCDNDGANRQQQCR